jgi:16S rRNA (guanine966-N2)-methyltransferase
MRVIAGSARGRRLAAPPGSDTRPTADRVREALFSILGTPPDGAVVLDLFAGAGTLGIEALSRGAERAVFADHGRAAARVLRQNLEVLGLTDRAEVHVGDATRFAARLGREGRSFSWIFLDPPYAAGLADATLEAVGAGRLLAPDGTVVVEHDRRAPPQPEHGHLLKADCRRYGDTELTFYRIRPP